MLVFVIALSISAYYFAEISIVEIQANRTENTRKTLKKAKQDLLAYAMNYPDIGANPAQGPGNFPCPDDDLDGLSDTGVGVVVPGCNSLAQGTMGRYPWATLQTEEYKDADGELLWYAVSSNYTNQANREINTSTTGSITLRKADGSIAYDGMQNDAIVAVIFSPGQILVRNDGLVQSRVTILEKDDPRNYLDVALGEDNASFTNFDPDGFITGIIRNAANDVIVNDLMIVITYEDIMKLVIPYVEYEISKLINDYFTICSAYPEASTFNPAQLSFDSAGIASPNELRGGHLPFGVAQPYNWGAGCPGGVAPALPPWLAAEGWDKNSYYAFAYQNAPPVNNFSCGDGVVNPPCITVNNTVPLINNAQALMVFSGRELPVQDRVTAPVAESDYFEGENDNNTTANNIFDAGEVEDYVGVITP